MRHKEWLDQPVEEWGDVYHTGLNFDFVALRDIEPDEEILIDYGVAWQKAWEEHVKNFVPPTYIPAYELNDELYDMELRTEEDRDYQLDGVQLYCEWYYLRKHNAKKPPKGYSNWPCRVIKKHGEDKYVVRLLEVVGKEDDGKTVYKSGQVVWGLPRDAFFFQDIPFSGDVHQKWAFRHPMLVPDDGMWPDIWNVDSEEESDETETGYYFS